MIFLSNWYCRQIDIFVKIDIFIKIDIFVKIDNSVKIVFLTISSTVFDDFINYRQLYQLLIFSSTIWSKYQMSVPVNCNFAGWLNKLAEDDAQRQNFCSEICDYRYFAIDNQHKRLLCTAHNPISIYSNYAKHQNFCFTFCIMLDTLQ